MIEINTAEDIKLIKEFAEAFSTDIDEQKILDCFDHSNAIEALVKSNQILSSEVLKLKEVHKDTLKVLDKVLKELEKIEKSKTVVKKQTKTNSSKKSKRGRPAINRDLKIFEPYSAERKEYQLVLRDGAQLLHVFTANEKNGTQKHLLPVNLFEFLIIAEYFLKGQRSIKLGEVKELCELFGITRPQFSKVYYNLTIGKFDGILAEVDKIVNDSVFSIKKSHIYRNNHDVNIDKKEFNELVSIYANGGNNFLTIYKLIKENEDIDPFDLLVILKKSGHVSKAIEKVE